MPPDMAADRIPALGMAMISAPAPSELPALIVRIARLWAGLHEADRDLALELARKLPGMTIRRHRDFRRRSDPK